MKKLISCLLILAIAFSSLTTAWADNESLANEQDYYERVAVGLGIVDAKLKEKEAISRADFAVVLTALINEQVAASRSSSYTDVNAGTKACGAIELLKNKDIMLGIGNNLFAPDEPMIYSYALRLILKATNNIKEFNSEEIVSDKNYDKLTKGIAMSGTSAVNYNTLVRLVFNALGMTVMPLTFEMDGTIAGNTGGSETVPEYFFNMKRISGILETDIHSSIKEASITGNSVTISGVSYSAYKDYNEFLGLSVDCFVDMDSNDVVFLTADDENKVTVVNERDIASYSGRTYTYSLDGKLKRTTLDYNVDIAYNDRVMLSYRETLMKPANGYVMLIDNNDDKDIDVVRVIEYVNIYVSGKSIDNEKVTIYDQASGVSAVLEETENADSTVVVDAAGVKKKISDVKAGMVASVIGEVNGSVVTARRVFISSESVTGTVTGINLSDGIITIDGVDYYISNSLNSNAVGFSQQLTFGIDFKGKLASVGSVDRSDLPMAIGYVINAKLDLEEDRCIVRVLTPYNKVIRYNCADKVKIEGSGTEKNQSTLCNMFTNNDPVIAYTVDEEKNIDKVMFASDYTANGPSTVPSEFGIYNIFKSGSSTYEFYPYFKSFWGKLTLTDSTVMFVIPEDTVNADISDYSVEPISRLISDKGYNVDGYVFDKNSAYCDVAVVHASVDPTISSDSRLSVIKKITNTLDADDIPVQEITLLGKQGEVTLYASEDSVLRTAEQYNDSSVTNLRVGVGDAVLYATDNDNRICKFKLVYDHDENNFYSNDYVGDGNQESISRRIMEARVYGVDSGFIQLMDTSENGATVAWDKIETLPMERVAIVVSEEEGGKRVVRPGSISDIESYKANGVSSKILWNSLAYIGYVLVVIK